MAIEKLLADLVAMPTISDDIPANDMALDYIEAYLQERGMYTERKRFGGHDTLIASTRPDNLLTPTVLLAAHVDVVGGGEALFTLRTEGDKLIGRGVYDMKFSIAGYMQVVDDLKGRLDTYDFGILITSDEETTDVGVSSWVKEGLRPKICLLPDSTAPGWDIETIAKGYWRFDLIAQGTAAHGGRPWEGESASLKLIKALHELKDDFQEPNPTTDSFNIGKIHGGVAHNMVPSEMIAGVDIRFVTAENLARKQALIRALCKKHDVTYRGISLAQPLFTDLTHPLVKKYLDTVETVTGKHPQSFISSAGTDAPYLAAVGITSIISCCEGGKHHTEHEWISRKSFLQFTPILHAYLEAAAATTAANVDNQAALV